MIKNRFEVLNGKITLRALIQDNIVIRNLAIKGQITGGCGGSNAKPVDDIRAPYLTQKISPEFYESQSFFLVFG